MKIINDPVFGFIRIPKGILYDIVRHPAFNRLSRIKQLGVSCIVYPGAQHTRFQHSLGAFHLTCLAVQSLMQKGNFIFESEAEAVEAAILMHDIGHGPFSHVLEHTIIHGVEHEDISLSIMERINKEMRGQLTLAINIFKNEYPKTFLHQLISSQLDMDRLDYLRRDSFFTGVTEGNIGSARIIEMLEVVNDNLVVEKKGIYSIENFLVSRRLMYWQVYLHKTSVAAEQVLIKALKRAKFLAKNGKEVFSSPALNFFLYRDLDRDFFFDEDQCLDNYLKLDDYDIYCAVKQWCYSEDKILSILSRDFIDRHIFKVEVTDEHISDERYEEKAKELSDYYGISTEEAKEYFISIKVTGKDMYDLDDDKIEILHNDGTIKDITETSDMLNISTLSHKVKKSFFCYQRLI